MPRGLFVTFEGSEGCGKSTQIERLRSRLEAQGQIVLLTREPGGTKLGESIRHLLKFAPEGEGMMPETELLLFAASRAQLVREVIEPALAEGTHVLADRFLDSTLVYQGVARGLNQEAVKQINDFAVGSCMPDLTLVLDMDTQKSLERARADTAKWAQPDRMEGENLAFYERIRQGFLTLARIESGRMMVVDADKSLEDVEEEIWAVLTKQFDGLFT